MVRSVGEPPAEQSDVVELIMAGKVDDYGTDLIVGIYREMLTKAAPTFGALLTGLAEPAELPALFHCTAGKDRTGIAAALLLGLLGVPDETVLDDYELSTTYRTNRRLAELRPRFEEAGLDVARFVDYLSAPGVVAGLRAVQRPIAMPSVNSAAIPTPQRTHGRSAITRRCRAARVATMRRQISSRGVSGGRW